MKSPSYLWFLLAFFLLTPTANGLTVSKNLQELSPTKRWLVLDGIPEPATPGSYFVKIWSKEKNGKVPLTLAAPTKFFFILDREYLVRRIVLDAEGIEGKAQLMVGAEGFKAGPFPVWPADPNTQIPVGTSLDYFTIKVMEAEGKPAIRLHSITVELEFLEKADAR